MALKKIFSGKYLVPAMHILFWGLYIMSPYFFRNPATSKGLTGWQIKNMLNNSFYAGVFYVNAYLLYPVLYKKRKQLLVYILSLVIVVASLIGLFRLIDEVLIPRPKMPEFREKVVEGHQMRPDTGMRRDTGMHKGIVTGKGQGGPHGDFGPRGGDGPRRGFGPGGPSRRDIERWRFIDWYIYTTIAYIFIIVVSISYRIVTDNARQEKIRKEKENENLKTELSFLRSQVSPHFIFNILNNMVALARKKSDMLEPSLIELSKLMRYMLYENDDERVSLGREVDYLKSYIALQLLRFGDDVTIMFSPPDNINAYYIEPMLLAPFVENAFKHGVGMVEDPQINITLSVDDTTGWMDFKVMNTVAPQQHTKDKDSGIGLVNVRRRLELLYKEDYNLDIMQNDNVFIAALKIKLK